MRVLAANTAIGTRDLLTKHVLPVLATVDLKDSNEPGAATWTLLAVARFALALIVMCSHIPGHGTYPSSLDNLTALGPQAAVLAFLVISGFSIAHSVEKEANGFYWRRFRRLAPVYWFSVVLNLAPFVIFGTKLSMPKLDFAPAPNLFQYIAHFHYYSIHEHLPLTKAIILPTTWDVIGNLVFVQGFLCSTFYTGAQSWSLAVEVWFYAIAPTLRRLSAWIMLSAIAVCAVTWWLNSSIGMDFNGPVPGHRWLTYGWAWLLGFLYYKNRNTVWANILLVVVGIVLLDHYNPFGFPYSSSTYIAVALTIAGSRFVGRIPMVATRFMRWLGDVSYPLYIVHLQVLLILMLWSRSRSPYLYLAVGLLAAVATLHVVDRPGKALLTRIYIRGRDGSQTRKLKC